MRLLNQIVYFMLAEFWSLMISPDWFRPFVFGIPSTISNRWFNYFPAPCFAQKKDVAFVVKL